jgi:hypothetical protein
MIDAKQSRIKLAPMGHTYLYDPVDGSSATHILRRYCDVLRIDSLETARRYVVDARKEGSKEAYDSLRASVLGLSAHRV